MTTAELLQRAAERRDYILSEFRWLVDGGVSVWSAIRAVGYQHGPSQLLDFYRNSGESAPAALVAEVEWGASRVSFL